MSEQRNLTLNEYLDQCHKLIMTNELIKWDSSFTEMEKGKRTKAQDKERIKAHKGLRLLLSDFVEVALYENIWTEGNFNVYFNHNSVFPKDPRDFVIATLNNLLDFQHNLNSSLLSDIGFMIAIQHYWRKYLNLCHKLNLRDWRDSTEWSTKTGYNYVPDFEILPKLSYKNGE